MTTIQERLRALLGYMDRGDYLVSQEDLAAVRAAADEIDRLQAALKASDEALLDLQHAATHLMPWTTHQAIRSAQSRVAAARSRESARMLIEEARSRYDEYCGPSCPRSCTPQNMSNEHLLGELAYLFSTALADLAKMTEERDALKNDTSGSRLISAFMRMETRAEAAESALARMKAQGTFADGWKMVPVEPTPEMYCRGDEAIIEGLQPSNVIVDPTPAQRCYGAMLSASPPFLKEEQKP